MPKIFGDNMIFQRNEEIRVFGSGKEGEKVVVSFCKSTCECTVENGSFYAELPPVSALESGELIVESAGERLVFNNICVGEVILAGGQSNMQMKLQSAVNGNFDAQFGESYNIRFFVSSLETPQEGEEVWKIATPESAGMVSAVAFYAAKKLSSVLKIPVGIIDCNMGATSVLHWVPTEESLKNPITADVTGTNLSDYGVLPKIKDEDRAVLGACYGCAYGEFYEKMFKPLCPFNVKAVLWYQGESDAGSEASYKIYKEAFGLLRKVWRTQLKKPNLPFITAMLANFDDEWIGGSEGEQWAYLRMAQLDCAMEDENTYLVPATDRGEHYNIHPVEKRCVGERMAACILNRLFDMPVIWESPIVKKAVLKGESLKLTFKNTYGRLFADLIFASGFVIKDCWCVYHSVNGDISGDTILINTSGIKNPQTIKYNFKNNAVLHVFNNYGLPLLPFPEIKIEKE